MKFSNLTTSTTSTQRCGAVAGLALGLLLTVAAGSASAQMYKWVDAKGKTHFSDQPPPEGVKPAMVKGAPSGTVGGDFPYALATAVRNYPVTLYTTAACSGCDQGRSYLKSRGIPYAEKTVSTEADEGKLKALGGDGLPFLMVGNAKKTGFQRDSWESMLNVALYPAKKVLPSSYQYPPAVAAVPVEPKATTDGETARVAAAAVAAAAAEEKRRRKAAPASNAPPGFQF